MRCRKCGTKAVINMRQHRLSLCSDHYLEWLPQQVERFIHKYGMFKPEDRILIAVSGGKDSLALWDILVRLGYSADGVYIDLGIDENIGYSSTSRTYAEKFANENNLKLDVVNLQEVYNRSIPDLHRGSHRGRTKPCSVCGLTKRYILNQKALAGEYQVLVTAHNLDDEAAVLLANTLEWTLEFLARGGPVLSQKSGFARKAKPFCRVTEFESAAYAFLRGIEFMPEECPFSIDSTQLYYKRTLNQWEDDRPGTKLRFYLKYLKALNDGAFPDRQQESHDLAAEQCPNCGQPTNTGGMCAFCRLMSRPLK